MPLTSNITHTALSTPPSSVQPSTAAPRRCPARACEAISSRDSAMQAMPAQADADRRSPAKTSDSGAITSTMVARLKG